MRPVRCTQCGEAMRSDALQGFMMRFRVHRLHEPSGSELTSSRRTDFNSDDHVHEATRHDDYLFRGAALAEACTTSSLANAAASMSALAAEAATFNDPRSLPLTCSMSSISSCSKRILVDRRPCGVEQITELRLRSRARSTSVQPMCGHAG